MHDDGLINNTIMYMYSYNAGFNHVKMLPNIAYLLHNVIHYTLQNNVKEHVVLQEQI